MLKLEQQRLFLSNQNEPSWDYVQAILWQAKCIEEFNHDPLYQYPSPLTNQSDKVKRNAHWICKFDHHMLLNKKRQDQKKTKKSIRVLKQGPLTSAQRINEVKFDKGELQ